MARKTATEVAQLLNRYYTVEAAEAQHAGHLKVRVIDHLPAEGSELIRNNGFELSGAFADTTTLYFHQN